MSFIKFSYLSQCLTHTKCNNHVDKLEESYYAHNQLNMQISANKIKVEVT